MFSPEKLTNEKTKENSMKKSLFCGLVLVFASSGFCSGVVVASENSAATAAAGITAKAAEAGKKIDAAVAGQKEKNAELNKAETEKKVDAAIAGQKARKAERTKKIEKAKSTGKEAVKEAAK
jgi:hypothetical protein